MRKLARFLGGMALLLGPLADAEPFLNWQDCLREAREHNPSFLEAQEKLRASESSLSASWGNFLPQATANGTYTYGNSGDSPSSSAQNSYNVGLSVTQNIFNGFMDSAKLNQSRAAVNLARAEFEMASAQLLYNLRTYFSELSHYQELAELLNSIFKRRQENKHIVELRYESGRENKGSVLLADAYLAQTRYEILQNQHKIKISQKRLAATLGRSNFQDLQVKQGPEGLGELSLSGSEWSQTPKYKQSQAQLEGARASLKISESAFYPTLSLNASSTRFGKSWFPENKKWNYGATLSLPLFSGGKDYFSVKSADASMMAAAQNLRATELESMSSLEESYNNLLEAREKIKVDQSFLKAAQTRAEVARNKYNNGLISFDDWDTVESDLILRQKNYLQSQKEEAASVASWLLMKGVGVGL